MKSNCLLKIFLLLLIISLLFIISLHIYLSFNHHQKLNYLKDLTDSKYIKVNSLYFNYIFQNVSEIGPNINQTCKLYNSYVKKLNKNQFNYPILLSLHQNKSINFDCLNRKLKHTKKKTILIYNDLIKSTHYLKNDFDYHNKEKCPISNCLITTNRSLFKNSDLVVFNLNNIQSNKLPKRSKNDQIWTYFLYEPFEQVKFWHDNSLEFIFNWSSTYTSDSTFFSFYYRNLNMIWSNEKIINFYSTIKNKEGSIATIIDECIYYKDHLTYLNELKKYIKVDVYGKCAGMIDINLNSEHFLEFLSKNYKFYFSFEYNLCDNYITDKFFNVIKYDIVPIIFKSFDHEKYIPKSGFINANQYSTAKSLADHILYLESNTDAYLSYFEWKKYVKFLDNNRNLSGVHSILCDMCIKMNLDEIEKNKIQVIKANNIKYDLMKNCYHLNWKNVLGFYYSDPYFERTFVDDLLDFLFH